MAVSIEPERHRAVLFYLDGVVAETGAVFDDARSLVARLHEQGVRTAVFCTGRACRDALAREDIAELMGWSEAKTRNLVYRGLDDLRRELTALASPSAV